MPTSVTQADWVRRVLGIDFGRPGQVASADGPSIKADWLAASETVDDQIAGLRSLLLASADPRLRAIAEYGLAAMTAGYKTRFLAAVLDMDIPSRTRGDHGPGHDNPGSPAAASTMLSPMPL